jgi:hypothetical protein
MAPLAVSHTHVVVLFGEKIVNILRSGVVPPPLSTLAARIATGRGSARRAAIAQSRATWLTPTCGAASAC